MPDLINTIAELHALPIGTVIYTRGHYAATLTNDLVDDGRGAYIGNMLGVRMVWDNDFPAEVIRIPDPEYALLLEQSHWPSTPQAATGMLAEVRDSVEAKRTECRRDATRNFHGEYKNPIRTGYDRAMTEVLELIDEKRPPA